MTTNAGAASLFANRSRTTQWVQRPLLRLTSACVFPVRSKTQRDTSSAPGDMLVFVAGFPAIYGKQPLYFADPIFKERAEIPAPRSAS